MGTSAAQKAKAKALTEKKKAERDIAQRVADIEAARAAAQDLEVTSASEWKSSTERAAVKLQLPSGNVCLARNPGMEAFLEAGMIPNSLLPIVTAAVQEGKGLDPKQTEEISQDPAVLTDVLVLVNRVLCHSVVQPKVLMPPEPDEDGEVADRSPNALYADEVDLEDRMFILQWVVGGTRDLERFRSEQASTLEGMGAVEDLEDKAE